MLDVDHIPAGDEHHTPIANTHLQGNAKALQAMNSLKRTEKQKTLANKTMHQETQPMPHAMYIHHII